MQVLDLKGYIKNIKKALKSDYLYSGEELHKLRTDLRNLEKTQQLMRTRQNNGFGQYVGTNVAVENEGSVKMGVNLHADGSTSIDTTVENIPLDDFVDVVKEVESVAEQIVNQEEVINE